MSTRMILPRLARVAALVSACGSSPAPITCTPSFAAPAVVGTGCSWSTWSSAWTMIYAKVIVGQEDAARQRVDAVLGNY